MKRIVTPSIVILCGATLCAAAAPPQEEQIAAAVQAAPEERRSGATVLGFDASGKLVELRAGSNDLVCLADDPGDERFSVACYHESLEPFMSRGRELRAEGKNNNERSSIRFAEIEAGALDMPRQPRTLYVLAGSGYDAGSDSVADAYLRWVIYVPFATAESTGLSTEPKANAPWLMAAGTAGAHIMISPPRPQ